MSFCLKPEGVSKLLFQCGSRDAINRVSTTGFNKLLIFNVLYVLTPAETWRAASLQHQCRNFDTPTTWRENRRNAHYYFIGRHAPM